MTEDDVTSATATQRVDCGSCGSTEPIEQTIGVFESTFQLGYAYTEGFPSDRQRANLCWGCYVDSWRWLFDHSHSTSIWGALASQCSSCAQILDPLDPVMSVKLYFARRPKRHPDYRWLFCRNCYNGVEVRP